MKKILFYCDWCNIELKNVIRHVHISTHHIGDESSTDIERRANTGLDLCYNCEDSIFKPKVPTLLENATGYGLGSPIPITIKEDTTNEQ